MPPKGNTKSAFGGSGWIRDKLSGDAAEVDPLVIRNPERQVILLSSANGEHSLLSRLGLHTQRASDTWADVFEMYNAKVLTHENNSEKASIKTDETVGGLSTWLHRLRLWPSSDSSIEVAGVNLESPWFCSFRGAIIFLHFLAFEAKQAPLSDSALGQLASKLLLQPWQQDSTDSRNLLKRILNANSKGIKDKFHKAYKDSMELLRRHQWWPPQWGDDSGPNISLVSPGGAAAADNPLPLALSQKVLTMEYVRDKLMRTVVGQPYAVEEAARAVEYKITGAAGEKCPWVMAFAGPSGHGKTHLADQLVDVVFGFDTVEKRSQRGLVYLEYSVAHFNDKSNLSALLGAPPGLVGSENPGKLIEFFKTQQERCTPAHKNRRIQWIVLLDEIDRAYPTLLEDLRSWMDQGVVRSGAGTEYEARNGMFIICTNVGAGASVRQADGTTRASTVNVLNAAMPATRDDLRVCQQAVKAALVKDLCHGQAPTYGRIKSTALFFQFAAADFRKNLSLWLHQNTELRLRHRNEDDPFMPNGLRITWDDTVQDWLASFYEDLTGFRGLELQLTRLLSEVKRMLTRAAFSESDAMERRNNVTEEEKKDEDRQMNGKEFIVDASLVHQKLKFRERSTGELIRSCGGDEREMSGCPKYVKKPSSPMFRSKRSKSKPSSKKKTEQGTKQKRQSSSNREARKASVARDTVSEPDEEGCINGICEVDGKYYPILGDGSRGGAIPKHLATRMEDANGADTRAAASSAILAHLSEKEFSSSVAAAAAASSNSASLLANRNATNSKNLSQPPIQRNQSSKRKPAATVAASSDSLEDWQMLDVVEEDTLVTAASYSTTKEGKKAPAASGESEDDDIEAARPSKASKLKRGQSAAAASSSSSQETSAAKPVSTSEILCSCSKIDEVTAFKQNEKDVLRLGHFNHATTQDDLLLKERHRLFRQLLARPDFSLPAAYELTKEWDAGASRFMFRSKRGEWTVLIRSWGDKGNYKKVTYANVRTKYAKSLGVKQLDSDKEVALWNFLRMCFCLKMHGGSPQWNGLELNENPGS